MEMEKFVKTINKVFKALYDDSIWIHNVKKGKKEKEVLAQILKKTKVLGIDYKDFGEILVSLVDSSMDRVISRYISMSKNKGWKGEKLEPFTIYNRRTGKYEKETPRVLKGDSQTWPEEHPEGLMSLFNLFQNPIPMEPKEERDEERFRDMEGESEEKEEGEERGKARGIRDLAREEMMAMHRSLTDGRPRAYYHPGDNFPYKPKPSRYEERPWKEDIDIDKDYRDFQAERQRKGALRGDSTATRALVDIVGRLDRDIRQNRQLVSLNSAWDWIIRNGLGDKGWKAEMKLSGPGDTTPDCYIYDGFGVLQYIDGYKTYNDSKSMKLRGFYDKNPRYQKRKDEKITYTAYNQSIYKKTSAFQDLGSMVRLWLEDHCGLPQKTQGTDKWKGLSMKKNTATIKTISHIWSQFIIIPAIRELTGGKVVLDITEKDEIDKYKELYKNTISKYIRANIDGGVIKDINRIVENRYNFYTNSILPKLIEEIKEEKEVPGNLYRVENVLGQIFHSYFMGYDEETKTKRNKYDEKYDGLGKLRYDDDYYETHYNPYPVDRYNKIRGGKLERGRGLFPSSSSSSGE